MIDSNNNNQFEQLVLSKLSVIEESNGQIKESLARLSVTVEHQQTRLDKLETRVDSIAITASNNSGQRVGSNQAVTWAMTFAGVVLTYLFTKGSS